MPADAILRILRDSESAGMDARSVSMRMQGARANELSASEVDRFLELMQLAGWTMMAPRSGDEQYRRYHLTELGAAQVASLVEASPSPERGAPDQLISEP